MKPPTNNALHLLTEQARPILRPYQIWLQSMIGKYQSYKNLTINVTAWSSLAAEDAWRRDSAPKPNTTWLGKFGRSFPLSLSTHGVDRQQPKSSVVILFLCRMVVVVNTKYPLPRLGLLILNESWSEVRVWRDQQNNTLFGSSWPKAMHLWCYFFFRTKTSDMSDGVSAECRWYRIWSISFVFSQRHFVIDLRRNPTLKMIKWGKPLEMFIFRSV